MKLAAAEGHKQRGWEQLTDRASRTGIKLRRMAAWAVNLTNFINSLATVILVCGGVYMISKGMITMGGLIASSMLLGRALAPFTQLAALLTRYNQTKESLNQLNELMAKPVERPANRHFIAKPDFTGGIEFRNVMFRYGEGGAATLNNLTFSIQPGEKIAIIGAVGSGKTTLIRLISNLYEPESGSILIDGTDVRQIDPGDLRRNVGAVQQNPTLFFGSIRENITMGHENAPERAVVRAAEIAGVMDFLRETELGLDTNVGRARATACPAASARRWPSPARFCTILRSCCSTSRPPRSTRRRRTRLIKHLETIFANKTVHSHHP